MQLCTHRSQTNNLTRTGRKFGHFPPQSETPGGGRSPFSNSSRIVLASNVHFSFFIKIFIFRLILQGWPRVQQRSAKFYHTIPYRTISQSVLGSYKQHFSTGRVPEKYFYKVKFNCVQVEIESLFFFFTVPFSFALLCFVIRKPILSIKHVQC